jgi:hypothetical protein
MHVSPITAITEHRLPPITHRLPRLLDSPDGPYRAHMNLSGATWRLSGLDIPDAVTARVAREIAQRISGGIDLHGG